MSLLKQIFTWWNGQTIGTRLFTWRKGQLVGQDGQGNNYYQTNDGVRRWVIYNGEAEASRIPPEWHGWMHHTVNDAPTEQPMNVKPWEKPHQPNLTGTPGAYAPKGSLRVAGDRAAATGDYEAWSPDA
ncbi:MAG: NADH:ubiquinone oxidoreductase subunit NDUFA12 [Alphaproteobacteria bacterium]